MEEIWKKINYLHGRYEASSYGRIRNSETKHIKAQVFDGHYYKFGYDYIYEGNRYRGWYRVHKAIAESFIPNPDNKPTVNHIDGDTSNNNVENLEWADYKYQAEHATKVLHRHIGEDNYNAKYTNAEIKNIRFLYEIEKKTIKEIADIYNERYGNIRRIVRYERWKYI
jgi:hypothetical protein